MLTLKCHNNDTIVLSTQWYQMKLVPDTSLSQGSCSLTSLKSKTQTLLKQEEVPPQQCVPHRWVAYTKSLQHEVNTPLLCLQRSHRSVCEAGVPHWICLSAAITGRKLFLTWAIAESLCEATHRYWCLAVQSSVLPQSANFHPSRENRQLDLSLLSKHYFGVVCVY